MANGNITVNHHKSTFYALFIPFASKATCGDVSVVKVFGLTVYERAGSVRRILGMTFKSDE